MIICNSVAISSTVFVIKRDIGRTFLYLPFRLTCTITYRTRGFFSKNFNTNSQVPELLGGAKILAKSSNLCAGSTNVTDDRQTEGRQTTDRRQTERFMP